MTTFRLVLCEKAFCINHRRISIHNALLSSARILHQEKDYLYPKAFHGSIVDRGPIGVRTHYILNFDSP